MTRWTTMSDELVVFPVPIGHYVHHPPLDVDAEVARVVDLFAEFGGREEPWAVGMPDRGGDSVAERLRCWSGAPEGNTVLYWVGHGWSDTRTASLAHARSPRAVAEDGVTPELGVAYAAAGSTPRLTAHTATPVILRSFACSQGPPSHLPDASAVPVHVGRANYPCPDVCQHCVP